MNTFCLSTFVLFVMLPVGGEEPPQVVIVAHPQVPVDTLTTAELKNMYMGKRLHWNNQVPVKPINLTGSPHEIFLRRFLDQSPRHYASFWTRMIFSGLGVPPQSVYQQRVALMYIARTPGAIGYVTSDRDLKDQKVKIIEIHP
ncbi:MAG: hypothetical protein QNK37_35535 [Acidobacteriota bacterium]|nr:hypothetical protein [Acidobacteriota bacterium]